MNDYEKLIEIIKELDTDCKYCKHSKNPPKCINTDILCGKCRFKCPCKTCQNNSNYEFEFPTEGEK